MLAKEWEKRQLRDKMHEEQKEILNKTRCKKEESESSRKKWKDQGSCEEY